MDKIPIGYHLDRTLKKIQSVYLTAFRNNGIELTLEQWVILERISSIGPAASQALVTQLGYRNRATTSRVISGLEKRGLLERRRFKNDNKQYNLMITNSGLELICKVKPITLELREIGYRNLPPESVSMLIEILDQINASYEEYEQEF